MFEKDLFGDDIKPDPQGGVLSQSWEYPPFSVLNAREGWWQERKRAWLSLGIKSELGRGGGIPMGQRDQWKLPEGLAPDMGLNDGK